MSPRRSAPTSPRQDAQPALEDEIRTILADSLAPSQLNSAPIQTRIRQNANLFHNAGIQSPAQLRDFINQCRRHDHRYAALGLGFVNNIGYAVGVTAANEQLVQLLPPSLQQNPALLGLLYGLGVGGLDVACETIGGKIITDQMFNSGCALTRLPEGCRDKTKTVAGFLTSATRPALLNILKDLPRLALPPLFAAATGQWIIKKRSAESLDNSLLDARGAFISNAINARKTLGDSQSYEERLLLRDDLADVIKKTKHSAEQNARAAATSVQQGCADLVCSPVPLALISTIGIFVAALFAATTSIDTSGRAAAEAALGQAIAADAADVNTLVSQRALSIAFFGLLIATLGIVPTLMNEAITPAMQSSAKTLMDCFDKLGAGLPNLAQWARQHWQHPPQSASSPDSMA